MHCSAVKLGGVLEAVGSRCNYAMFFCMEFIVLCGFSHDTVLFLYYTATLENQRDICSVFCLSWSVSVKDPVLRGHLVQFISFADWVRLPEVHGVMRRNSSLGQILVVLI